MILAKGVALLVALLGLFEITFASPSARADPLFDLNIVHVNDFHARFEETNNDAAACKSKESCIGGFSRLYSTIMESIADKSNSILLNAGDNFQGTLWYNIYKWNVTQYFLNKLPFDAIVLGNHEFDDGIKGAVPFIQTLDAPVIVSNIDDSLEPEFKGTYKKSTVIERNGKKIGLIGVIIKTASEISNTGNLKFYDEAESVIAEAERLVKEEKVFTNIVLSHSGYDVEKEMARKVTAASKIGLIVGGHSHSFLYTGEPVPGPDTPEGPYPTIVNRKDDGKQVLVVQASAYCKYLGKIVVSYNEDGDCVKWEGKPIFLDTTVKQDEQINKDLQPWKDGLELIQGKVLGSSLVTLNQEICHQAECLLGNFVTDVAVYDFTKLADENSWTYASLAVFNAGGLRTAINSGNITYNDMMTSQPFKNTFDVGEIQGKYIKEMFEFTTTPYAYQRVYVSVNLLQVSGFHIRYDLNNPEGSRVTSIKVRCNECKIPIYEDIDLNKTYRLIVPSFLTNGGDGYKILKTNLKNVQTGRVDIDSFTEYLSKRSPIFQEVEGRIVFEAENRIVARHLNC